MPNHSDNKDLTEKGEVVPKEHVESGKSERYGVTETRPTRFISEGMRDDIERFGKTLDPFTGQPLTKDDLNKK